MKLKLVDITDEYDHQGVETLLYDIFSQEMNRFVGRIEYRNEVGRDLTYYGNIGYVIYPPYRGHRFAFEACKVLIDELKVKKIGLHEVYLTCNPDNLASQKTIQNLGGIYVDTVDVPQDHELYRQGDVRKEIYRLII